jgi:hypothetical protein
MEVGRITPPDWGRLCGGSDEANWLSDRDRKLGLILKMSEDIIDVAGELDRRGALFSPTPEILLEFPFAADWYISLAGYALKTLGNIKRGPQSFGLTLTATTIRRNLAEGRRQSTQEVAAFAAWLTSEIDRSWSPYQRTPEQALVVASAILGGRAIGQGQNAAGNDAVLLLKSTISTYCERTGIVLYLVGEGQWVEYSYGASAVIAPQMRIGDELIVTFPVGGNVPDVRFTTSSGRTLAVGEVKGRKDLSNLWESWAPQVVDHMRTWTAETPGALRLFFGTVITDEMIRGESVRGTSRVGLRELYEDDYLQGVYNLSHLSLQEPNSVISFAELMQYLIART